MANSSRWKRCRGTLGRLVGAVALACGAAGCASPAPLDLKLNVTAMPNRDIAALVPDDVVRVMRRAGFTDGEILEVGPEVRNAISSEGAAKLKVGDSVEALLAVDGPRVQVSSRRAGNFIYVIPAAAAAAPVSRPAPKSTRAEEDDRVQRTVTLGPPAVGSPNGAARRDAPTTRQAAAREVTKADTTEPPSP